jgi:hypothetical protein
MIKEIKLECIRTLEQEIDKTHATNGKDCISGKKTPKRNIDFGSPLPPREGSWTPKY